MSAESPREKERGFRVFAKYVALWALKYGVSFVILKAQFRLEIRNNINTKYGGIKITECTTPLRTPTPNRQRPLFFQQIKGEMRMKFISFKTNKCMYKINK